MTQRRRAATRRWISSVISVCRDGITAKNGELEITERREVESWGTRLEYSSQGDELEEAFQGEWYTR